MSVVINELEVVAMPPEPPPAGPSQPSSASVVTPIDLEAILRRLRERQDRVRAS